MHCVLLCHCRDEFPVRLTCHALCVCVRLRICEPINLAHAEPNIWGFERDWFLLGGHIFKQDHPCGCRIDACPSIFFLKVQEVQRRGALLRQGDLQVARQRPVLFAGRVARGICARGKRSLNCLRRASLQELFAKGQSKIAREAEVLRFRFHSLTQLLVCALCLHVRGFRHRQ